MEIAVHTNPAEALAETISQAIAEHTGDTLCFLAGGSALAVASKLHIPTETKGRTIFCMGDERASGNSTVNNYMQLQAALTAADVDLPVLDTSYTADESLEVFTNRIQTEIQKWISTAGDLKIICILGVGADGHTAGIFPLDPSAFSHTYIAQQMYVPIYLETLRIDSRASLTPGWILSNADTVYGYAVGQSKQAIVHKLIHEDIEIHDMPAQIIKMHHNSHLYTDVTV